MSIKTFKRIDEAETKGSFTAAFRLPRRENQLTFLFRDEAAILFRARLQTANNRSQSVFLRTKEKVKKTNPNKKTKQKKKTAPQKCSFYRKRQDQIDPPRDILFMCRINRPPVQMIKSRNRIHLDSAVPQCIGILQV